MKKAIAFLTVLVMLSSNAAAAAPASPAIAAGSYDMSITVDLSGSGKAISPYIYGINEYGHQDDLKKVTATALRQGGNRMTAYNWETNASNAGSDWKYSSDNNLSASDAPADCVQQLSKEAEKYNVGYKLTTLQLAGYAAADKNGTVTEAEAAPSERWNEVKLTKGGAFAESPDLTDGTVYMDEYVNYIIGILGDSQTASGIQGYSLDNEPALWHNTHSRIHPNRVSAAELRDKSVEMAAAVKKLDPNAEIFGPALYGYTAYDHLADTDSDTEWETIKAEGGYHWYIDYYLDSMKKASDAAGTRLLDVLDIHYYSESCRNGTADRLQSVRTLYEKGFVENSWIGQWCQTNIPILPTVQASIDKYFSGTKLGVTEYNFGGDDEVSGAIAQAEALGCYADAGVYFASLWGGSGYILSALNLYTNYDGKGGCFGSTLMPASTEDVSKSSAYAAKNDDASLITVMVTNKELTTPEHAVISLSGAKKTYQKAAVYMIDSTSTDIQYVDVYDVSGGKIDLTLPAYCAAMVVVSDDENAFADAKPEEQTLKSAVYDAPMDLVNKNGYVEIPITDPAHLKQIIITGDVTSSAGSQWGSAGCAVCINAVTPDGTKFWTSKGYSLSLGTGSKAIVEFDGTLNKKESAEDTVGTDVEAVIADGKVELQQWWSSSEKQEANIADTVSVKYTRVEVIYSYTGSGEAVRGDVNADGKLDSADAVMMQQFLCTEGTLTDWNAGDLDESGKINAADLTIMKRLLLAK
ncbi:MAG: glycoside hydrolase [Oscillospiraceae bacterium]|nr:glycoside hydrolase [Oscillospiraceae bacterium]